ncbi:YciI family protein [Kibdelosporangium lantanae]
MAKYLLMIFGDEQAWGPMSEQEREDHEAAHAAFRAAAGDAVLGGHELMRSSTATTLRAGPTTTDGPFLETKEVLGGYYVIEAPDLDAAIAITGRLPEVSAGHGGVEIRPILEHAN